MRTPDKMLFYKVGKKDMLGEKKKELFKIPRFLGSRKKPENNKMSKVENKRLGKCIPGKYYLKSGYYCGHCYQTHKTLRKKQLSEIKVAFHNKRKNLLRRLNF